MPDVQLDARRREAAQQRIDHALRAAAYHEAAAKRERSKAEQIARTWQIELRQDSPAETH
jgi:hypothetical protein